MQKLDSPIYTERLILRHWKTEDFQPFYQLNSDPEVMEFFPKLLTRDESDQLATEIQTRLINHGWGFWAVEEKSSGQFVGFVGLNQGNHELPFNPCIEIGWRLDKPFWGKGYATEAGRKSLQFAFESISVNEVVSFTAVINKRSEAVMQRLGMYNSHCNFNHPMVSAESPLYRHVLYIITIEQWLKATK